MIAREKKKGRILPTYVAGGPANPLGARALYLGSALYRIHGTNQPWTIGGAVSSGCIRMRNEDVVDLYERVGNGTKVVVIWGPTRSARPDKRIRPRLPPTRLGEWHQPWTRSESGLSWDMRFPGFSVPAQRLSHP